jgi:hypothetical protein
LFAWRQKHETFRFSDPEHERFNFKLRAPADNREEVDPEYTGKFADSMVKLLYFLNSKAEETLTYAVFVMTSDSSRISRTIAVRREKYRRIRAEWAGTLLRYHSDRVENAYRGTLLHFSENLASMHWGRYLRCKTWNAMFSKV